MVIADKPRPSFLRDVPHDVLNVPQGVFTLLRADSPQASLESRRGGPSRTRPKPPTGVPFDCRPLYQCFTQTRGYAARGQTRAAKHTILRIDTALSSSVWKTDVRMSANTDHRSLENTIRRLSGDHIMLRLTNPIFSSSSRTGALGTSAAIE